MKIQEFENMLKEVSKKASVTLHFKKNNIVDVEVRQDNVIINYTEVEGYHFEGGDVCLDLDEDFIGQSKRQIELDIEIWGE